MNITDLAKVENDLCVCLSFGDIVELRHEDWNAGEDVFTNQTIILHTLAGTVRRLSEKPKCRFFEGLPAATFDAFISFTPPSVTLRRSKGVPSYPWMCWKSDVVEIEHLRTSRDLSKWLAQETWIIVYKPGPLRG
jgi:hypothetical protein